MLDPAVPLVFHGSLLCLDEAEVCDDDGCGGGAKAHGSDVDSNVAAVAANGSVCWRLLEPEPCSSHGSSLMSTSLTTEIG